MLTALYDRIGYHPKNEALFIRALTHSSYGADNYERMEFLGDAVLEMYISEQLYLRFKDTDEGVLSKLRSELVCESSLCEWARSIALGGLLRIGHGEEQSGGRDKPSILCDAAEAVLCAVYLDGGGDAAKALVLRMLDFLLELHRTGRLYADAKTALQELTQKNGGVAPAYELISEIGPPHDRMFKMKVLLNGRTIGQGSGRSKKQAEQDAARDAIINGKWNKQV